MTRAALSIPSVAEFTPDLADSFAPYAPLLPQGIAAFSSKLEPGASRLAFCLRPSPEHLPIGHDLLAGHFARFPGALSRL
jgi:hypothetical protein